MTRLFITTDIFTELITIHLWHHNIADNQIRLGFFRLFNSIRAVFARDHMITTALQQGLQPKQQGQIIINQQNGTVYFIHW